MGYQRRVHGGCSVLSGLKTHTFTMASVDDAISQAYDDVRSDSSATNWFKCVFDGKAVNLEATGEGGLAELLTNYSEADNTKCSFAYVRITTGDEESKRAKFALIDRGHVQPHRCRLERAPARKGVVI